MFLSWSTCYCWKYLWFLSQTWILSFFYFSSLNNCNSPTWCAMLFVHFLIPMHVHTMTHLFFFPLAGISLKTQELYALVFASRYLDIFTDFISLYNTVMKLIFLGSSFSILWYMRRHKLVRRSYDREQDTFRHYFLILPCLVLALLINEKFTFKEVSGHVAATSFSKSIE